MVSTGTGTKKVKPGGSPALRIPLNVLMMFRHRKKARDFLSFVICVLAAVTLLFFIKCITRESGHGRLLEADIAAATTAANTTAAATTDANSTEASFNESTSSMEENFTKWNATLPCRRPGLRILYFVHTAPKNVENRTWLRKTIGNPQIENLLNSAIVFFVGVAPDPNERRLVEEEAAREGDVAVLTFTDAYRNMSLKFLQGAKWVKENCFLNSNTTIVKIDDDVMVNVFALSSYVDSTLMRRNSIHCHLHTKVSPIRDPKSKWYVTKKEYALDKYPAYCAGAAVMMRPAVLSALYEASTQVPIFWVDDVYVTGILASLINVDMVNTKRYTFLHVGKELATLGNKILFLHTGLPNRINDKLGELWRSVLSANKYENGRRRWMVKLYHRKTLPWLVDWVVRRTGNPNLNVSKMQ